MPMNVGQLVKMFCHQELWNRWDDRAVSTPS